MPDYPPLPGIYVITDLDEGKCYVGSSVDLNIRITGHQRNLKKNQHSNPKLQEAFNQGHKFSVLPLPIVEKENILEYEQILLDEFLHTGVLMNIYPKARAPNANRSRSEESKEKSRQAMTGFKHTSETIEILKIRAKERGVSPITIEASAALKRGVPLSPERVEKLRIDSKKAMENPAARQHLQNVNVGILHSLEDREKMKRIQQERWEKIRAEEVRTGVKRPSNGGGHKEPIPISVEGVVYPSINQASKAIGVAYKTVAHRVRSRHEMFNDWKHDISSTNLNS